MASTCAANSRSTVGAYQSASTIACVAVDLAGVATICQLTAPPPPSAMTSSTLESNPLTIEVRAPPAPPLLIPQPAFAPPTPTVNVALGAGLRLAPDVTRANACPGVTVTSTSTFALSPPRRLPMPSPPPAA